MELVLKKKKLIIITRSKKRLRSERVCGLDQRMINFKRKDNYALETEQDK